MKPILLILFLSSPAYAQQQNFQIDPLEFSDCLPRWDRKIKPVNPAHRLEDIQHLRTLIKHEKTKTERVKLLHRLSVFHYQEYEAIKKKEFLAETIKVLTRLIPGHPGYNKLGEVYLLLGEALWSSGRDKEALKVFKMFIKNYPNSPDIPRGYIFFGEFFFKKQNYKKALMMFQKAESLGSTEYAYCAAHRIAYCFHKLGNTQDAIEWLNKANELRGR